MCGRFALTASGSLLESAFELEKLSDYTFSSYNIAPSQHIPVVHLKENKRVLSFMKWGLVPFWNTKTPAHTVINARCETLSEKPMFRRLYSHQRCLIPASGFYEWQTHSKQPFYFTLPDTSIFAFAGIWDKGNTAAGEEIKMCALITQEATEEIRMIHHRMPVILHPYQYGHWLEGKGEDFFSTAVSTIHFYPVSRAVNSPNQDTPALITPVPALL